MGLLITAVVSGMFLKGLCVKGLVLIVALLKSSGIFKRQGLVGGLGSLELCSPRRLWDAGIFLFCPCLSHKVRVCSTMCSQAWCTALPLGQKQWGPIDYGLIPTILWAKINCPASKGDCLKYFVTGSWLTRFLFQDSFSSSSQKVFPLLHLLEMETCELNS